MAYIFKLIVNNIFPTRIIFLVGKFSDDSKAQSKSLSVTTNQYVKTSYGTINAIGHVMIASVTVNYAGNTPQYTGFYFQYNKMTNLKIYAAFGISSLNENHIIRATHDNSAFEIELRSVISSGSPGDWGTGNFIGSLNSKGL